MASKAKNPRSLPFEGRQTLTGRRGVLASGQGAVDGGPPDAEFLGNRRCSEAFGMKLGYSCPIDARLAAFVHSGGLSLGNALKLALSPEVGLEFREYAQHVEEALASGRARVDRLFCGLQDRAPSVQCPAGLRCCGPADRSW
jgi:hypothetical protein